MNETIGQGGGMAAMAPRGIGEILSTAFQLYRRYWRTLMAIAAVVVVPLTLVQYGIGHWVRTNGQQYARPGRGLDLVLGRGQRLTAGRTRRAAALPGAHRSDHPDHRHRSRRPGPRLEQSYRFGFARLGPILVVSILVGLATLLGLIVFIIPGIYIGVRLAVSIQALVVEGKRGTQAMRRSWDLVGGHWWHAALTLLVGALITGVVNAVITAPFSAGAWLIQGVAAAVATTVTLPYGALVGVLLYLDLRARKERLDLDTLNADLQASTA